MKKAEKKIEKKLVKNMGKRVDTEKGLMAHSHYFQTLADPFNVHGEKIPDNICYPSSTFSITDRRVLTLTSNGGGAVIYGSAANTGNAVGSLVPTRWINNSVFSGDNQFCVGFQTTGTGTFSGTNILPSAVGEGLVFSFPNWNNSALQVPGIYSKARLVSAGFSIEYLGTALNAKGRMTIAAVPRVTLREKMTLGAITLLDVQNLVGAKIIPINKLIGGTCVYHPLDSMSMTYTDLDSKEDNSTNVDFDSYSNCLGSEIYMIIDGAEANATCQITSIFNYEGIPRLNTLNIVQPTFSRDDPIELSMAKNAINKVPTTFPGTDAVRPLMEGKAQVQPSAAPTSSTLHPTEEQREEGEEESFMTKVLDGAEDMLSNAPGIIGKAAPLVRKGLSFLGI
jgi:hypothetical protein